MRNKFLWQKNHHISTLSWRKNNFRAFENLQSNLFVYVFSCLFAKWFMLHFNEWFRKKYQFLILGTFYMKWMIKLQKDIFTHFLSHLLGILQLVYYAKQTFMNFKWGSLFLKQNCFWLKTFLLLVGPLFHSATCYIQWPKYNQSFWKLSKFSFLQNLQAPNCKFHQFLDTKISEILILINFED